MIRSIMFFALTAFLFSNLVGCIIVDGHHRGNLPPGQAKKLNH